MLLHGLRCNGNPIWIHHFVAINWVHIACICSGNRACGAAPVEPARDAESRQSRVHSRLSTASTQARLDIDEVRRYFIRLNSNADNFPDHFLVTVAFLLSLTIKLDLKTNHYRDVRFLAVLCCSCAHLEFSQHWSPFGLLWYSQIFTNRKWVLSMYTEGNIWISDTSLSKLGKFQCSYKYNFKTYFLMDHHCKAHSETFETLVHARFVWYTPRVFQEKITFWRTILHSSIVFNVQKW